ncbi:MAG: beta-Ala-His dipeptidase [Bacteroidales bacterium]|nr:beta-Ala-His dipeptidase [Bacteroidales bacterium]
MTSETVLDIFKEITRIPRESGHEGPITEWLCKWAEAHGLEYKVDDIHNVCIIKNAAPGKENVPTLVLQAHQDMVCEKNEGFEFDFSKDPIPYVIEDGWMVAKDTTLGADDGIGIAACLALLESDRPMGRLECIFTISEETGMDGADAMQEGFFTGKTLINLDSEDEGQLFIGCAGGEHTDAYFEHGFENIAEGSKVLELSVTDALGGHSGDDINKLRANTVKILADFLERNESFQLVSINGGGKSNAIARECKAVVASPCADVLAADFEAYGKLVRAAYSSTEPALRFSVRECEAARAVESGAAGRIIGALAEVPHGVVKMSPDITGLVQTSTNLAAVSSPEPGVIKIATSQRSSVEAELDALVEKVAGIFRNAGARVDCYSKYPGWKPDLKSKILKDCVESYRRLFGEEPLVLAIHAGLECGLFLEKFPGLDMISFGPTLRGVHAPGEKLELASMDRFEALLDDVVCNFK